MAFATTKIYLSPSFSGAPAGHTVDMVKAALGAASIEEVETFSMTAGTYVNANIALAFDALIAAVNAQIQNLINTDWGVDTVGKTINYNAQVLSVTRLDSIYLAEVNGSFLVKVSIEIVIS